MNAVVYGPTRTLQIVLKVTAVLCLSLALGRVALAVFTNQSFVPKMADIQGIGCYLIFYYFALIKSAWAWSNAEIESQRQGYPINYDLAVKIHYSIPMGIIFFVTALIPTSVLPLSLCYLGYRAIAGPITQWISEQQKRNQLLGDVQMKQSPRTQAPLTITPKFIPPQDSSTPTQQQTTKVEPGKKIRLD